MSKIIGNTVGMGLPKPNLMQNDPTKGDYVKGKEEFLAQAGAGSGQNANGLTTELKTALTDYFRHVMPEFDDQNGLAYVNAVLTALGAETREESGGTDNPGSGSGGEDSGDSGEDNPGGEESGVSNESTWTSGVAYTFEPILGSYPDKSTGVITDYSGWQRSPYLYCAGASTLRGVVKWQSSVLKGTNDNAFYDADKNYVAPVETFAFATLTNAEVGTFVDIPIPENAAYFIVSGGNTLLSGNNSTNNEPYIEYVPY